MSYPPSDDRPGAPSVIPIGDAPRAPERVEPVLPAATAQPVFEPEPLNTLRFKPLIVEALSKVFDPEIPVNIYELGLVYDIGVDAAAAVRVAMTLTAPACPAAQTLPAEVERRVRAFRSNRRVSVVWDPKLDPTDVRSGRSSWACYSSVLQPTGAPKCHDLVRFRISTTFSR